MFPVPSSYSKDAVNPASETDDSTRVEYEEAMYEGAVPTEDCSFPAVSVKEAVEAMV